MFVKPMETHSTSTWLICGVVFHVITCGIGYLLGAEKDRGPLGLTLAFLYSVLGLIVVVSMRSNRPDRQAQTVIDNTSNTCSVLESINRHAAENAKNSADVTVMLDQINTRLERLQARLEAAE